MKKTPWQELTDFVNAHPRIMYNDGLKTKFKNKGRKALLELADHLEATGVAQNCEYSYNKGGIAVSGDHALRGQFVEHPKIFFHIFFNLDGFGTFIVYRTTKGMEDYSGGPNHFFAVERSIEDFRLMLIRLADSQAQTQGGEDVVRSLNT